MQSAYQQLDNMEAEEVEAITQEAALLWREQQAIFKEMTTIQLQSKVAKVRLAWREAASGPADGPDSNGLPDDLAAGDAEVVQLKAQLATDEAAMARLQRDLTLALTLALTLTLALALTLTLTLTLTLILTLTLTLTLALTLTLTLTLTLALTLTLNPDPSPDPKPDQARLQRDLDSSRRTLQQLQADIPSRVVSSRRLTTLRLVMRQQQAHTDEPYP